MSQSTITFRAMISGDLVAARELWKVTEGVGLSPEETPEMLTGYLERNPEISSVAISSAGELIGALLGGHDGRRGYLYHLAVKAEYRGRGVSRRLVERSLNGLALAGLAKTTILVYSTNETGRAYWRHMGWHLREDLNPMQIAISSPLPNR